MKNNRVKALKEKLTSKLWFNVFLRVGIIFLAFVAVLTIANKAFLSDFFLFKQEKQLIGQMRQLSELDLSNETQVTNKLSQISEKYNFEAEIYNSSGQIIYTTRGSQMMDYFSYGHINFSMAHEDMETLTSKTIDNGITVKTAVDRIGNNQFIICEKQLESGIFAEIRMRKELILSSAETANDFIIIVAAVCFLISIAWVFVFARKFSRPIAKMNEITKDMSCLKFDRRVLSDSNDEIGQLAMSINEMSDSLSTALLSLKESNARLKDEIELERQLDAMRREFVANVSHELKTPIAIINGYAEGLKLNINADAKEDYCNTIIDESQRMNRLVMSLLELSRYESGQIPINCENFNISELARQMCNRIFASSDITVNTELPEELFVFADPLQIEQVLKAYLENAKSHTESTGVIKISHSINSQGVRINVYNSGSCVDEELMPQIWQSFYRGDTSHKREQSRFGLGLSIVGAICRLHGKSCGVYNTEDGVCFWFECDAVG